MPTWEPSAPSYWDGHWFGSLNWYGPGDRSPFLGGMGGDLEADSNEREWEWAWKDGGEIDIASRDDERVSGRGRNREERGARVWHSKVEGSGVGG